MQTKVLFLILFLFVLSASSVAQTENNGAIKLKIEDSIALKYPGEEIIITYSEEKTHQSYCDTVYLKHESKIPACLVPPGMYSLTITSEKFVQIHMTGIKVSTQAITFLETLTFIPKSESKKRVRKKYKEPVVMRCG